MKIALIGYGKMGKEIERIALEKNHSILLKVDIENADSFSVDDLKKADAAIEFTTPHSAFKNILKCFEAGVPVVCGTTGWNDNLEEAKKKCTEMGGAFFYSSNYSIGVNIFFELNKKLAAMMKNYSDYDVSIEEIHHTAKLDKPSGTAITLAEGILSQQTKKEKWKLSEGEKSADERILPINSVREENVPGTHHVRYLSSIDKIEITHEAFSRKGFAAGALLAAEWIAGRKGVFGMSDLLK